MCNCQFSIQNRVRSEARATEEADERQSDGAITGVSVGVVLVLVVAIALLIYWRCWRKKGEGSLPSLNNNDDDDHVRRRAGAAAEQRGADTLVNTNYDPEEGGSGDRLRGGEGHGPGPAGMFSRFEKRIRRFSGGE